MAASSAAQGSPHISSQPPSHQTLGRVLVNLLLVATKGLNSKSRKGSGRAQPWRAVTTITASACPVSPGGPACVSGSTELTRPFPVVAVIQLELFFLAAQTFLLCQFIYLTLVHQCPVHSPHTDEGSAMWMLHNARLPWPFT